MTMDAIDGNRSFWDTVSSWGSTIKSSFWSQRQTTSCTSNLKDAELARFFYHFVGMGALAGGAGFASLAAFHAVSLPLGLLALPCALTSLGVYYYKESQDFESRDAIKKLHNKASLMSLESIVQTYGWNDMLRLGILSPEDFANKYRAHIKGKGLNEVMNQYEKTELQLSRCSAPFFHYHIPRPKEHAALWREETASIDCEQIFRTYPLEKLQKYSLVESGELECIKILKSDYDEIKAQHDQKISQIGQKFLEDTATHKGNFDREYERAAQVYREHPVVKELQSFEMHYTKELLKIQELQNKSISEARVRFNNALASSLSGPVQDYSRLTPADKAIYDRCKQVFQRDEAAAQQIANQQIAKMNQQRHDRLMSLNTEESRLKRERTQAQEAAKRHYDEAIRGFVQQKEAALRPIESSLQATAADCDRRYRAYLRISKNH